MANKIPVDQIRGLVNMGREAEESMGADIHISVLVDPTCPSWLAAAVRDALVPERDALVDVHELVEHPVVAGYDVGIMAGSQQGWCATGGRLVAELLFGDK